MLSFNQDTQEEFWENFISNYNFLSPVIIEPLIKLSLRELKIPTKQALV